MGKGGGFDLVLNKIRAHRVGNLIFGLTTCLLHQIQEVGGDLINWLYQTVHLNFWSVKSHPFHLLPLGEMVGHTIFRHITCSE